MQTQKIDPYLPMAAEVVAIEKLSRMIYTLQVRLTDHQRQQHYRFYPGQFNMLYLYGVGEVAISIVSDPDEAHLITHTIKAVGRVTKALEKLRVGDSIGLRGPYGRGWPLHEKHHAKKDVIVVTGGLGCAPSVSIVQYILARRKQYGSLTILQGVKHSDDFIFHERYKEWEKSPNTTVYVSADEASIDWKLNVGHVTDIIQTLDINPKKTIAMLCGPEVMMHAGVVALTKKSLPDDHIYLSMERNMKCGFGQCGHCQYGGFFICKDGPVFPYSEIKSLFNVAGF